MGRIRAMLLAAAAAALLSGCQKVSEEQIALREAGIAAMAQGDYAGAVEQFDAAVEASKKVTDFETDVLKYRAEAEFMLEDYGAAAHTYDILSQIDGEEPEYCYFWGLCLAKSGDGAGAEEKISRGRELDKEGTAAGYKEAMTALGEAYLASGDQEKAESAFQDLIHSGKADGAVYNRLLLAAMEMGDYEKALEYASEGLSLSGGEGKKDLAFNQAVCYEYLGEYEKALELFRSYAAEYGSDERAEHEIAFLETR